MILHIRIRLYAEFKLKLTILIFWSKFTQKGYFRSKINKKIKIDIRFRIFELV